MSARFLGWRDVAFVSPDPELATGKAEPSKKVAVWSDEADFRGSDGFKLSRWREECSEELAVAKTSKSPELTPLRDEFDLAKWHEECLKELHGARWRQKRRASARERPKYGAAKPSFPPLVGVAKQPAEQGPPAAYLKEVEVTEVLWGLANPSVNAAICRGNLTVDLYEREARERELAKGRRVHYQEVAHKRRSQVAHSGVSGDVQEARSPGDILDARPGRLDMPNPSPNSTYKKKELQRALRRATALRRIQSKFNVHGVGPTITSASEEQGEDEGSLTPSPMEAVSRTARRSMKTRLKGAINARLEKHRRQARRIRHTENLRKARFSKISPSERDEISRAFDLFKNADDCLEAHFVLSCLLELGLRGNTSLERSIVEQEVSQICMMLSVEKNDGGTFLGSTHSNVHTERKGSGVITGNSPKPHAHEAGQSHDIPPGSSVSTTSGAGQTVAGPPPEAVQARRKSAAAARASTASLRRPSVTIQEAPLYLAPPEDSVPKPPSLPLRRSRLRPPDLGAVGNAECVDSDAEEALRGASAGTAAGAGEVSSSSGTDSDASEEQEAPPAEGHTPRGRPGRRLGEVHVALLSFWVFCADIVPNVRQQLLDTRCDQHLKEYMSCLDSTRAIDIELPLFEALVKKRGLERDVYRTVIADYERKKGKDSLATIDFETFHVLFTEVEERTERHKRAREREIMAKSNLSKYMCLKSRHEFTHFSDTFRMFDTDSSGFLSHVEVKRLLKHLGLQPFTPPWSADVAVFLEESDTDGDYELDFAEFIVLMQKVRLRQRMYRRPHLVLAAKDLKVSLTKPIKLAKAFSVLQTARVTTNPGDEDIAQEVFGEVETDSRGCLKFEALEDLAQTICERRFAISTERSRKVAVNLGIPQDRLSAFQMAYDALDVDGSGTLDIVEVGKALATLMAVPPTSKELKEIWRQVVGNAEVMKFHDYLHLTKLVASGVNIFGSEAPFTLKCLEAEKLRFILGLFPIAGGYIRSLEDSELPELVGGFLGLNPDANLREDDARPIRNMRMLTELAMEVARRGGDVPCER